MKLKITTAVLVFLLVLTNVFAYTTIDQHNVILEKDEKVEFTLEEFSYVNIRTYVGNTVTLNVGESKTAFTLTQIEDDGQAHITVVQDGQEQNVDLDWGADALQIPIKDRIPVIFIESTVFNPGEDGDPYVVIKYTIPTVQRFNPEGTSNEPQEVKVTGAAVGEPSPKDPYLKYFIAAIILLLIIIVILGPKPKKAQVPVPEPPVMKEEKPKAKKTKKEEVKTEEKNE